MIQYRTVDSPIGLLTLAGHGSVLTNLRMVDQTYEPSRADWSPDPGAFGAAVDPDLVLPRVVQSRIIKRRSHLQAVCEPGAPNAETLDDE